VLSLDDEVVVVVAVAAADDDSIELVLCFVVAPNAVVLKAVVRTDLMQVVVDVIVSSRYAILVGFLEIVATVVPQQQLIIEVKLPVLSPSYANFAETILVVIIPEFHILIQLYYFCKHLKMIN
jgi:hypothetical protein